MNSKSRPERSKKSWELIGFNIPRKNIVIILFELMCFAGTFITDHLEVRSFPHFCNSIPGEVELNFLLAFVADFVNIICFIIYGLLYFCRNFSLVQ
jgi:hypothetical protein